jgi:hypothetical protein
MRFPVSHGYLYLCGCSRGDASHSTARRRLALPGFCAAARYGPCLTAGPIFSVQQLFVLLLEIACADFEILQDLLGEEMQIGRDPAQNEGEVMTLIVSQVFAILADGKPTRPLKRRHDGSPRALQRTVVAGRFKFAEKQWDSAMRCRFEALGQARKCRRGNPV